MISAGEASGDLHAANLLAAVREQDLQFWGMGGPRLAAAGSELLVDCGSIAYFGFVDVVIHYRKIMRELERRREEADAES